MENVFSRVHLAFFVCEKLSLIIVQMLSPSSVCHLTDIGRVGSVDWAIGSSGVGLRTAFHGVGCKVGRRHPGILRTRDGEGEMGL